MNKKFSTLMAGLMLASAFSVGAQNEVQKYESGKAYLLGSATGFVLRASSDADSYGDLKTVPAVTVENSLKLTKECLWIANVTEGENGNAPKFVFVNKATNLTLTVDPTAADKNGNVPATISGSAGEWLNTSITDAGKGKVLPKSPFYSYYDTNKVVYIAIDTFGELTIKTGTPSEAVDQNTIQPIKADLIKNLSAYELNTQLRTANITNSEDGWFNLSFNKDVTSTGSNLFANTALHAVDADQDQYVLLQAKDQKVNGEQAYIVVDTAYHVGTEAVGQLVKFTYANLDEQTTGLAANKVARLGDSYKYKFSYEPNEDRLIIEVKDYLIKKGAKSVSGTNWNTLNSQENSDQKDFYLRLATLTTARELTVANNPVSSIATTPTWNDKADGMLTTVKIGVNSSTWTPTTIPTGLYTIKLHMNGRVSDYKSNGQYFIANLGGNFGFAEQAKNQLFDHIPAAQWYVEKQGNTDTAPITITNREFDDNTHGGSLGASVKMQAFKANDGRVFFAYGAFATDTLEFIPVTDASKKDENLGYKHVTKEEASVETYVFNYLHGLSLDKGLNTPSDKDSLVRVDENGDKIAFRLVPVVNDDSYGLQTDAKKTGIANLVRNVYYVKAYDNLKFATDDADRYLTYDKASKKYVMSTVPTPYFLKENNCIDGEHYYALVEANLYKQALNYGTTIWYPASEVGKKDNAKSYADLGYTASDEVYFYDEDGDMIVTDDYGKTELYAYAKNSDGVVALMDTKAKRGDKSYSWDYASNRVSVDDNTLDLTQAVLNDKFYSEIRVSAFAVVKDDSPLYRRFNGVAPESYGDASNAPLNLKFFRYNNNAEYLFENSSSDNAYRDGINDKTISFLGVNNAYQFEENANRSYTMFVDTAYVRNNTRMPQYLIGIRPEVVEGDTIWCNATSAHHHDNLADSLACDHTVIIKGFTRAMYLFNAQDSIDAKNFDYQGKAAYGAKDYTRLAFVDAVHAQDTLYILKDSKIATKDIVLDNGALFSNKIALDNNKHKNVVFQFRLIDEDNNRFLIESETEQNNAPVFNKDLTSVNIAPSQGGWIKVQNGVPVIARFGTFDEAIAQAEVFDVNDEIKYEATANDEIAVEGVSVVAGNGQVTIMGAAGKNVTITNILGKVIASQVIASDNATIAVPAGIVAVAVEGEAAVKAIVK